MQDFLLTTPAQAVIWTTALLVISMVSYYVVARFRDRTDNDRSITHDLLTNFRDLHRQGVIEETEFREIKTVLGTKLREELKTPAESRPATNLNPPEQTGGAT